MKFVKYLLIFLLLLSKVYGQGKKLSGTVVDGTDPIPMVSIRLVGPQPTGTSSRPDGTFTIQYDSISQNLRFSAVGYKTYTVTIQDLLELDGRVIMEPATSGLNEVVITASSRTARYRNKNNPAVEFIRQVISHLDSNNARKSAAFAYNEYEKLCMSLSLENAKVPSSKFLNKYSFLKRDLDSTTIQGHSLVPVFIREKSTRFSSKGDSVVLGVNEARIDLYLDEDGFDAYMDKLYGHPDLYSHDIRLGNRQFLSPVAPIAPIFYKYYITDTIKTTTPWQLVMSVFPRNRQEALFSGHLYINLDSTYAVQHAAFYLNDEANINWVNALHVEMTYKQDPAGKYFMNKSKMSLQLGVFETGTEVFGEKTFIIPDLSAGADTLVRPEPLGKIERTAFANVDSLKNSKSFRRTMSLGAFLLSGYVDKGPIEIGPVPTFYSFNPVEGSRIRLGGRTTNAFSKRFLFDFYGAYGTKDKIFKYGLTTTVSLTPRSVYEFPVRSLTLSHSYDVEVPGQEFNYLSVDNVLLSFRRGKNNKMWYNKKWLLEYFHETPSHLSYKFGVSVQQLQPGGILPLENQAGKVKHLDVTELFTELRWAPNETFYQGKRYRRTINNGAPVFTLRFAQGVGSQFNYQRLVSTVSKRFFFSQLGHTDVLLEGGAVFGYVPYPLLIIHRANQSYSYEQHSYNLMNFMEFGSDRYASINIQHSFDGFLFNKIPVIKKAGLREVVSLKVLTGGITKKNGLLNNKPSYNFPKDEHSNLLIHSLNSQPYMEASFGVSNIFKVLRVDWVQRLTYLNGPNVSNWGIRAKLQLDF